MSGTARRAPRDRAQVLLRSYSPSTVRPHTLGSRIVTVVTLVTRATGLASSVATQRESDRHPERRVSGRWR